MFDSISTKLRTLAVTGAGIFGVLGCSVALADSISPSSFSANLAVGESATVRKTVVVSAGGPTSAVVDIMFVFDTTGSMGAAIAGAQTTATTLLTTLNATYGGGGGLQSGAAFYNDPGAGITSNLTAAIATTQASINGYSAFGGGDFEELGYDGIGLAASNATWRPGSNRFIVALGDAGFKDGAFNQASTAAALTSNGVTLIGLDFCANVGTCGLAPSFEDSVTGLGGQVLPSGTSAADIAAAVTAGIGSSFGNYSEVTVSDLLAGLPEFSVSTVCVSADSGACVGPDAVGTYDRSVDRTFEFDVTFTRLAGGDKSFSTFALVDGGIVATEADRFPSGEVPAPASLALLGAGLAVLGAARSRRAA